MAAGTDGHLPSHPDGAPRAPSLTFAGADPATFASTSVAAAAAHASTTGDPRHLALAELGAEVAACTRCRLAETRTQVVFGVGNPDADLMFVGEAPGFHEDKQGFPFVGQAGKLLDRLLGDIGLTRADVYVANVLKCLRYTANVQLGDGSWERIGRLVRSRYAGEVMSIDDHGALVRRRVTGWHETPLAGRRVFRLTYRSAKGAGAGRVGIELTGDHPVLTERGYVPVDELTPADRIATGQGLSTAEYDLVCGTLLGDGRISDASAHVQFSHSQRQRDYALFKADLLAELEPRVSEFNAAAVAGGPRVYGVVAVRTLASRALGVVRRDFYVPQRQVPRWIAEELNERMLAIWFMDDGHTRIRPPRKPLAEIATNGFDDGDIQLLLRGLARLGLAASSLRGRIHFGVPATERLSELIAPFVPPSMRYKLHPEVERNVPFDPRAWVAGPRRTLYDEPVVVDVTDRDRTDVTFFCLDVAGTHNFVTAGGVVHNCRPPGNRDPMPDEIEACETHLFRQVALIEPKLIATLGNFATKLLSGRPDGITKVHGRPQEARLGERTVTLYPIYHPAAALYTPAMLRTLEEDFARLPGLLADGAGAAGAPEGPAPARAPEPTATNLARPTASAPEQPVLSAPPVSQAAPPDEQLGLF